MNNFLIIGGNSLMVSEAITSLIENEDNFLYIQVRNKDKFLKTHNEILNFKNYKLLVCDLLSDEIFSLLDQVENLKGFCYLSGATNISLIKYTKRKDLQEIFEINYFKPFFITQYLIKNKKIQKESNFLYVSSISGLYKLAPGISNYSNSKAALNNLVKNLTIECKKDKIKFNTICPGVVVTKFNDEIEKIKIDNNSSYPLGHGLPSTSQL